MEQFLGHESCGAGARIFREVRSRIFREAWVSNSAWVVVRYAALDSGSIAQI
jgi:hypothetical protein